MADEVKTEEEEQKPFEWTNDAGDKFSALFDVFGDQLKEDLNNLTAIQNLLSEIDKKLPDVAIIDVKLDKGDNDGIELLSHIKKKDSDIFL